MTPSLQLPPRLILLSRTAAVGCWLAAIAWPTLALLALASMEPAALLHRAGVVSAAVATAAPAAGSWPHVAAVVLLALPAAMAGWALASLGVGFRALAAGGGWLPQACSALRRFAGWSAAAAVGGVVAAAAASVLLTLGFPPGQRALAVGGSSALLQELLVAALVWVFAHLLLRAHAVAEENAQFV
ncbi:MAG TPA: hypothetical protein VNB23_04875 [Ramlibacter sp.]|nr:hypothetical protein [Ramlibacter sp.]